MAFYNHWHCKFTGIIGFVNLYEDGLKYRMLTEKAKYKAKILLRSSENSFLLQFLFSVATSSNCAKRFSA